MSLQKFRSFLSSSGLTFNIIEFPDSRCCKTAVDAAKMIQCEPSQIANSLIFKTSPSSHPILILTAGHHRVNEKQINAEHFSGTALEGEIGVSRADAQFVKDKTGYPVGGIPPFGHDQNIVTFIDETLASDKRTLWAAGGTPNTVFSITADELMNITKGKVVNIS